MKDEAQRHHYQPSTLHMGDCAICGNVYDAPLHIGSPSEHRHSHSVGRTPTPIADSSEAGTGGVDLEKRVADLMWAIGVKDKQILELSAALSSPVGEPVASADSEKEAAARAMALADSRKLILETSDVSQLGHASDRDWREYIHMVDAIAPFFTHPPAPAVGARPHSIYSKFHLDNWTDEDFAKHPTATRKTLAWLLELEAARAVGTEEVARAIRDAQPATGTDVLTNAYERGRFDGVMEYAERLKRAFALLSGQGGGK